MSKSIEFVNFMNCFICLLAKSCLFVGQVPCFDVSLFSISRGCCSRMHRYIRWSVYQDYLELSEGILKKPLLALLSTPNQV
jgi:hypothetical protein